MKKLIWKVKKLYYRLYQKGLGLALRVLPFPKQELCLTSEGYRQLPIVLKEKRINRVCIVCSKTLLQKGLLDPLFNELKSGGIVYVLFSKINQNPTIANIEEGCQIYKENTCEGLIAVGGGSPLDCAKIMGIKISNPRLSYRAMKHMLAIRHEIPFMVAIPSTAGSGSESTVAAVLTDPDKKEKYPITSLRILPKYVILDENLTISLPAEVTAYTGMDALTHAIEAYIGTVGTKETNQAALKAIQLIFHNLELAYVDGTNRKARRNLLLASNYAGYAFTRAFVGYVHTISHALSAIYNVPHGKTNAIVLPYVLEAYGKSIEEKLKEIAVFLHIADEREDKKEVALRLIKRIRLLNQVLFIPEKVKELKEQDIMCIAKKAASEGNPADPVPKILSEEELSQIIRKLL